MSAYFTNENAVALPRLFRHPVSSPNDCRDPGAAPRDFGNGRTGPGRAHPRSKGPGRYGGSGPLGGEHNPINPARGMIAPP
jgi:hypothetical protein